MKIAALDLGSNSFLCLLCEASEKGITKIHKDLVEIVRLGKDLSKTKKLQPEALERARECLQRFRKEMELFKPEKILAYATSAARDAENSQEFLKLGQDLGIEIHIISGKKEAQVTYQGVFWGNNEAPANSKNLLIDIGGGSTEIIFGQGENLLESISLNMGAVRMTERCLTRYPLSKLEIKNLKQEIIQVVGTNLEKIRQQNPQRVVAVAGTPTTLVAAGLGGQFTAEQIEGYTFEKTKLIEWEQKLSTSTIEEIIQKHKIPKDRADILYSGVVILKTILEAINKDHFLVSTRGVRFGIVADYFNSILS